MQCPVCKTVDLMMTERQGIEIDYCPQCRGVWLDRGELDKIIERSVGAAPAQAAPAPAPRPAAPQPTYQSQPHAHHGHHDGHHGGYYKKKKRESFLSDLFDF